MATNNAIDNTSNPFSTTAITIDPGASSDSYIQFDINAINECRLGVDDADDSLRLSHSSALGTSDSIVIDTNGHVTLPLNASFLEYLASDDTVTILSGGTGANLVLGSNTALTEVFDVGSNFSTSTFTAPADGIYLFTMGIHASSINSEIDNLNNSVSARWSISGWNIYDSRAVTSGYSSITTTNMRELDVSDAVTANMSIAANVTAGDRSLTLLGSANRVNSYAGYLVS